MTICLMVSSSPPPSSRFSGLPAVPGTVVMVVVDEVVRRQKARAQARIYLGTVADLVGDVVHVDEPKVSGTLAELARVALGEHFAPGDGLVEVSRSNDGDPFLVAEIERVLA